MKEAAKHGAAAYLIALGVLLAMLACLDMQAHALTAAGIAAGCILILTVCSIRRLTGVIAWVAALAGAGVWLALGGLNTLAESLRGVALHFAGVNGALPMVALQTVLALTVIVALAVFAMTGKRMGAYPALAVTVLAAMILWLSDRGHLLPWLAPAVAGVILQAALSAHEELALRRVLPMAVALTALTFLLTPADGVTITPLKQAADKLRDQIYARFMFTQPRNVFTLAAEGYYPQGQHQLGGKAEPVDHPVMMVKTSRTTYLRGSVKNEYTGRVWLDTMAGRRYLWSSPRWREDRTAVFNMALPQGALGEDAGLTAHQSVSVRMLDASASSLFAPQRIRSLNPGGELVPYFNSGSEVFVTRDLQKDDTYTVTAPLFLAGDAGLGTLVNACAATDDPLYAQILHDYTALPDHLQEQVFLLAQEASQGAETPYDKALAIQRYLALHFTYTLDVAPQPENIDFVSNFLLNTKEGYCTYFASAMTVLCRMVGLPARYVEGYLAEPDEEGHAYVTGLHGHAWTEVYFAGFGWLTFDATPAQSRMVEAPPDVLPPQDNATDPTPEPEQPPAEEPTPTPEPEQNTPPPQEEEINTPAPSDMPEDDPVQQPEEQDPPDWRWLWWLLPLVLIIACALRIILTQPERCAGRARDEMGRWSAWMQAVSDALRVAGLPRQASESPMAYMKRIDGLQRFPVRLQPLGECMALVFYGRMKPEPEETAMAADACRKLMGALSPWQRIRVTCRRAFVPIRKRSFTQ